MKREDLIKLGVAEDVVDKIMAMNGQDIEKHKNDLATQKQEFDAMKTQLADANKQIESFKGMNYEEIKQKAQEWEEKFKKAESENQGKLDALKFDHALDAALTGAKAKNAKAVRALLSSNDLKLAEDGSILGLDKQLEKIKSENDYLFESEVTDPKLTLGGKNNPVLSDAVIEAARRGAGLKPNGE